MMELMISAQNSLCVAHCNATFDSFVYKIIKTLSGLLWFAAGVMSMCVSSPETLSTSIIAISKQEVSDPISCWVTFDPAESPILPGRNIKCVLALVNKIPKFPKKKHKFL